MNAVGGGAAMLAPEQVAHYEAFGFLVMRRLFSAAEMEELSREADAVLAEDRQGRPFDGQRRQAVMAFVEKRPLLTQIAEDDRVYLPVEQLLGPGFVWTATETYGLETPGGTPTARSQDTVASRSRST